MIRTVILLTYRIRANICRVLRILHLWIIRTTRARWIGFGADLGRRVAEKLGVDIEFREIDWDNKFFEIDTKGIDCAWEWYDNYRYRKSSTRMLQRHIQRNQQVVCYEGR